MRNHFSPNLSIPPNAPEKGNNNPQCELSTITASSSAQKLECAQSIEESQSTKTSSTNVTIAQSAPKCQPSSGDLYTPGPSLDYVDHIEAELRTRGINYKFQDTSIWIYPPFIKSMEGRDMLVPGTRNFMIKSFMGIRFTPELILITISSNRIIYQPNQKKLLLKFINYLNLVQTLCPFFLTKATPRDRTVKFLITAKRTIFISSKLNLVNEFLDEIVSLDKMYQNACQEYIPFLNMKYQLKHSRLPRGNNSFEVGKTSVDKAIKGMGFSQEKRLPMNSPIGKMYSVVAAVNTDPLTSEKNSGWKVFPISVEITENLINLKIKLCRDKHIVKIEDEKAQSMLAEFINYANNGLKKAQFKFNYATAVVFLEANLITAGLDFSAVQAEFQKLFSYIVCKFKKYGECLSTIYQYSLDMNSSNLAKAELKQEPAPQFTAYSLYMDLKKRNDTDNSNEYSQFLIHKNRKIPEYMIIPQKYIKITYNNEEEFIQEKEIIGRFLNVFDECYHLKINEETREIKYPIFNGKPIQSVIQSISEAGVGAIHEFLEKLYANNIRVNDFMKNLSISKECGYYIVYFSETNFFSYISLQTNIPTSLRIQDALLITMGITTKKSDSSINSAGPSNRITFFIESDFDSIFFDTCLGNLGGKNVELIPVCYEEIVKLESAPKLNLSNIDSPIGYFKKDEMHYLIRENLEGLYDRFLPNEQKRKSEEETLDRYIELARKQAGDQAKMNTSKPPLTNADIHAHFVTVADILIQLREFNRELVTVTDRDLFLKGDKLIIRFMKPRDDRDDTWWRCQAKDKDKDKTYDEMQVYSLAMLLYKLHTGEEPFTLLLEHITVDKLLEQLKQGVRCPLFAWEFEEKYPKLCSFLRACWNLEIKTIETMKSRYPSSAGEIS